MEEEKNIILEIKSFYEEINCSKYIDIKDKLEIKERYKELYKRGLLDFKNYKYFFSFLKDYKNLDRLVDISNNIYIRNEINNNEGIFNINGVELDSEQKNVIVSNEVNTLVVAGAGSGKSLTIVGKVKYLIKCKGILESEILCISFTNEACNSLKKKLKDSGCSDVMVLTFHKLGLKVLNDLGINYQICDSDYLDFVISEYLNYMVMDDEVMQKVIIKYLSLTLNISNNMFYRKLCGKDELKYLGKLLHRFISLFKANCYKPKMFELFLKESYKINSRKSRLESYCFLLIVIDVYKLYECELGSTGQIDFNDMIIRGYKELNIELYNYKYIIIDEFQDTSLARMLLIKKIINYTGSKLIVVGDDFQSIYRFTGCNLDIFVNFCKYFTYSKVFMLNNTYRNSKELIKVASDFVMKNDSQIVKELRSNKRNNKPIKLLYYDVASVGFEKIINLIYGEILVLGRNNGDIKKVINRNFVIEDDRVIYLKDRFKKIRFLTVHKAKGLEEENIVLINLESGLLGFPNEIKDFKVMSFVINSSEDYMYSEERRLFYVALTRTKGSVYLLVPRKNQSIFVKEIMRDNGKYIEVLK